MRPPCKKQLEITTERHRSLSAYPITALCCIFIKAEDFRHKAIVDSPYIGEIETVAPRESREEIPGDRRDDNVKAEKKTSVMIAILGRSTDAGQLASEGLVRGSMTL